MSRLLCAAFLAALAASAPAAAQGSVSVTRTYDYDAASLQLRRVTEAPSDGPARVTEYRYAHEQYSGMLAKNMLSQPYRVTVCRGTCEGAGADIEARTWTTWQDWGGGRWRPGETWRWHGAWLDGGQYNDVTAPLHPSASDSEVARTALYEAYDGYGRPTSALDPRNARTTFTYGPNNAGPHLTRVEQHSGGLAATNLVREFAYDAAGRLTAATDEAGHTTTYAYDEFGRLSGVRTPETALAGASLWTTTHAYVYGSGGAPGHVTTQAFANASTSTLERAFADGLGRPLQTQTRTGTSYLVSHTEYDAQGRPWRAWRPYTRATGGAYDASFATHANAHYNGTNGPNGSGRPYTETLYTADPTGRVREAIMPGRTSPTSTRFTYGVEVVGGLARAFAEATDELNRKSRTRTDALGNEVAATAAYGTAIEATTATEFDVMGRATRVVQPGGQTIRYVYDGAGRLLRRESPDGGTARFKYDRAGNVRFTQDANRAADYRLLFTRYDFAGRATHVGEAGYFDASDFYLLDPTTTHAFETASANWNIVNAHDERPGATAFPWSLFATQINALTLQNTKGRLAGRASRSDGAWQAELYSYDRDGRLKETYTYTANASNAVLTALSATHRYTYDLQGRLLTRHSTVGTKHYRHWYAYDDAGRPLTVRSGTGTTTPATPDVTYTYNGAGGVASQRHAALTTLPYAYDVRGWLTGTGSTGSTTYPFSAAYTYNAGGLITTTDYYNAGVPVTNKRHRVLYQYDARGRVTTGNFAEHVGSGFAPSSARYRLTGMQYDRNGNVLALTRYRGDATLLDQLTYHYAAGTNRLSSVVDAVVGSTETWDAESTGTIPYDANGNMTAVPVPYSAAAAYDWRNLPQTLTHSGVTTRYRYSASGQRFWKKTGTGAAEFYALDGLGSGRAVTAGVFSETASTWDWNVLSPGGEVLGRQPHNADRRYYVNDHLGSVRAAVTAAGAIVEARDYDAWGVLLAGRAFVSGQGAKEGYTGHERDGETGLDYAGARYYLSAYGRWNGADPLAGLFPGWSPYNYVLNNPLSLVDPDGMAPCERPPCAMSVGFGGSMTHWVGGSGAINLRLNSDGMNQVVLTMGVHAGQGTYTGYGPSVSASMQGALPRVSTSFYGEAATGVPGASLIVTATSDAETTLDAVTGLRDNIINNPQHTRRLLDNGDFAVTFGAFGSGGNHAVVGAKADIVLFQWQSSTDRNLPFGHDNPNDLVRPDATNVVLRGDHRQVDLLRSGKP